MRETEIQKRILAGVSDLVVIHRSPAGLFYQGKMIEHPHLGRILLHPREIKVLEEGYPDLTGFRRQDGKAVLIEVKTKTGKATDEQERFIAYAAKCGCAAGIARSVAEARAIVTGAEEKR